MLYETLNCHKRACAVFALLLFDVVENTAFLVLLYWFFMHKINGVFSAALTPINEDYSINLHTLDYAFDKTIGI